MILKILKFTGKVVFKTANKIAPKEKRNINIDRNIINLSVKRIIK